MADSLVSRFLELGSRPADTREERIPKRLQIGMAAVSIPLVGVWGSSFLFIGHPELAGGCALYCAVTAGLLGVLALTRRFELFCMPHLIWVMAAPFVQHWLMGGFLGSGGAFLWTLLAPVAGMMVVGIRRSLPLFGAAVLLLGASVFCHRPVLLTPPQLAAQFAFNGFGFLGFLFFSTHYFVDRLEAERRRSEELLLNILPAPIAERLKRGDTLIADRFEQATVLFSDIVGFTVLSSQRAPEEILRLLDRVFSGFDEIAGRFGLEKIKTIGDAYMLVGGVPGPRPDHAERVASAALAMRDFVEGLAQRDGLPVSMRIGIHTGPLVAGVIGRSKFAYDLWGDTVNTASRMESHGAPGRVHVSEATRALLERAFLLEERGAIEVKGKGEMRTYWLNGARAPAEAADEERPASNA